ncbi:hypothetical protein Atai01_73870 [Amycolatopsis taiwanensis]|uniref:Uncharacterized protein n=1 Tax=Amycolatopsis taiwanensis TaxID=342230 RepID=A0A9W6R8E8_9PSEU|nr:hypothetical protein Atai01_73870 [Amycolatopsis taiwanensis]
MLGRCHHVFGVTAQQPEPKYLRTDRDAGNTLADLVDHAGELVAGDLGRPGRSPWWRPARSHRTVEGLYSRGLDADPDLPGADPWSVDFHQTQHFWTARLREGGCSHLVNPFVFDVNEDRVFNLNFGLDQAKNTETPATLAHAMDAGSLLTCGTTSSATCWVG